MPYITEISREKYDGVINSVVSQLCPYSCTVEDGTSYTLRLSQGDLNYVITSIITRALEGVHMVNYGDYNTILGVLESVKQEFYRRVIVPYENKKKKENGDVY